MRRWLLAIAALAAVGLVVAGVVYVLWKPKPNKNGDKPVPSEPVTFLDNGLSAEDRKVFYHLAEGSEVYPLDWLRVTKRKGSDKFFLDDFERFGLLPDPDSKENLPVGLTAAVTKGLAQVGKMTGINCAACHVGQISYKGKARRIDGAPNMFDGNGFFTELVEAGQNILSSPEELIDFLHRLEGDPLRGERKPLVDRLLAHLAKDESDLKKAFLKRVDRVARDAKSAPVAKWTLKPGADGDARKKLLDGIETKKQDEPSLAEAAKGAGSPLGSHSEQDRQDAVRGTLDDVIVIVRLLVARVDFLKNLAHIGKGKPDWGFGRVDAFGSVIALYFNPDAVPNAPVSYPHLFAFERNPWFHYDGNTTSVLQRNLGQALGVGAIYEPDTYSSTLRPIDSDKLERLAGKLKVPAWPADFFSAPLDKDKVAKGQALFEKHCVSCHPLIKPSDEAPDKLSDLKEIATDPLRATNVAAVMPKSKKPFYDDLAVVLEKVTKKALDDANVPPDKQAEFSHGRQVKWRTTQKYAQRPLWGVWATAPYLHNGSVPTLYDLLLPVKERPATFPLGQREYDPVKVGYVTKVDKPRFTFDVSKAGNSNSGHEYGTTLGDAERYELIEFMKTL